MKLLIPLFLIYSSLFAQTTYKSLASEYYYLNYEEPSKIEWLERDIIISDRNIVVKSFGKEAIDIQSWTVHRKKEIVSNNKTLEVIKVFLSSGEEHEYPATFTIIHPHDGNVELITCEIPPDSVLKLADGAPITVRLFVD